MHGDWASVDEDGYWFLHGRSDDTLNIAGKRIGPAELESAVVAHPSVAEAAAVGVPHEVKGEVAWVFCVARARRRADDELAAELRGLAADALGKAFAPGARAVRLGAAEDAQREDRPARGSREGARRRPRRPLVPGEPRGTGGDRACRSQLTASTDRSPSSPAAGAGSARTSRASCAAAGARVAVAARTRAQVEHVAREIDGVPLEVDVSDRASVDAMAIQAESELGPIDLLVANAGIGGAGRRRPGRSIPTSGGTCSR